MLPCVQRHSSSEFTLVYRMPNTQRQAKCCARDRHANNSSCTVLPMTTGSQLGRRHVSYSLNSLKGGYMGDYIGDYYRGY